MPNLRGRGAKVRRGPRCARPAFSIAAAMLFSLTVERHLPVPNLRGRGAKVRRGPRGARPVFSIAVTMIFACGRVVPSSGGRWFVVFARSLFPFKQRKYGGPKLVRARALRL